MLDFPPFNNYISLLTIIHACGLCLKDCVVGMVVKGGGTIMSPGQLQSVWSERTRNVRGTSNKSAPWSMSKVVRAGVDESEAQGAPLFSCTVCNVTVSSGLYAAKCIFIARLLNACFVWCRSGVECSLARSTAPV